jgi:cytochrome P450
VVGCFLVDEPLPSAFKTSALDPIGRADPHQRLDRLRKECPVLHDRQLGGYFLTRYADVRAVLSDRELWRDPDKAASDAHAIRKLRQTPPEGSMDRGLPPTLIVLLDDPDHSRIRDPLVMALNKRVAASTGLVKTIMEDLLRPLEARDSFDLIADFARPAPVSVIAHVLGVDRNRLVSFREWSEACMLMLHPMRSAAETARMVLGQNALHQYFLDMIEARRAEPKDDLVSDLVGLQAAGAPINDNELQMNLRALLVAGNLTTTDLIGSVFWLLLSNPEQFQKLRENPQLVNNTVEETLRMEPPVDLTARIASREMTLGEQTVHVGQSITPSLRGANRDPQVYSDPHRFNIERREQPHVAFGGGTHFCAGAALARLEAQTATRLLLAKFPGLSLLNPEAPPRWRALPPFRGLEDLHVRVSQGG